jgi:hypothetical protein
VQPQDWVLARRRLLRPSAGPKERRSQQKRRPRRPHGWMREGGSLVSAGWLPPPPKSHEPRNWMMSFCKSAAATWTCVNNAGKSADPPAMFLAICGN